MMDQIKQWIRKLHSWQYNSRIHNVLPSKCDSLYQQSTSAQAVFTRSYLLDLLLPTNLLVNNGQWNVASTWNTLFLMLNHKPIYWQVDDLWSSAGINCKPYYRKENLSCQSSTGHLLTRSNLIVWVQHHSQHIVCWQITRHGNPSFPLCLYPSGFPFLLKTSLQTANTVCQRMTQQSSSMCGFGRGGSSLAAGTR